MAPPRAAAKKTSSVPEGVYKASKIEEVPLDKIRVDRSYQRDLSSRLVEQIVANWDEVASELVLISNRGNRKDKEESGFFIINGQHRTAAARKLDRPKIWARIIDLSKEKDPAAVEAELRLKTNVRLSDRPLERFKAQLRAGDPRSLEIKKLFESFDTEANFTPSMDAGINAISTVEQIYDVDGGKLLKDTFQVIKEVFPIVGGKFATSPMLKGIAWFIEKHDQEADRARMVERVKGVGITALDRRARTIQSEMGGSLWMNYYRAIVGFYNERLTDKYKLDWKMRGAASFSVSQSGWGGSSRNSQ